MAPSNASLAQAEAILSAVLAAVVRFSALPWGSTASSDLSLPHQPQGGNPYQALDVALSRTASTSLLKSPCPRTSS